MGLVFSSMAVLALAVTPQASHGEISASLQIADGVGAAMALALVGASFTALLDTDANPYLPGFLAMVAVAGLALLAATRVPKLTGPTLPTPGA
jgi:sugar phosphate permease